MATVEAPKEGFLLVVTCDALQILHPDFQSFALDDVPTSIFAEEAWQRRGQKIVKTRFSQLDPDQSLLLIEFSLLSSIFSKCPLLTASFLQNKRMANVVVIIEAIRTKGIILADSTLVDVATFDNLFKVATIAIIIVRVTDLLCDQMVLLFCLLFPEVQKDLAISVVLSVTAQRT